MVKNHQKNRFCVSDLKDSWCGGEPIPRGSKHESGTPPYLLPKDPKRGQKPRHHHSDLAGSWFFGEPTPRGSKNEQTRVMVFWIANVGIKT
nr:MetaGeneMark_Unknown Function [uncultured bacterium]